MARADRDGDEDYVKPMRRGTGGSGLRLKACAPINLDQQLEQTVRQRDPVTLLYRDYIISI